MTDNTEALGTAICGACQSRGTVYYTEHGLRCMDCIGVTSQSPRTYAPELREHDDSHDQEMADNVEAFNESLPDIGFDVEMQDGSTYEMDKFDAAAVMMKYDDEWEQFLDALADKVAEHYEKQTEPTKHADYAPWGSSGHDASQDAYGTHAALAPVVAYSDLRAAKMQLGLMALSGDDEDPVSVIGIGDDFEHIYGEHGRVTIEHADTDETNTGEL